MSRRGPGPATGVVLSRDELLWVLEQCGVDAWPYPLRRGHWDADTPATTAAHRRRAEAGLRERGLLDPGPARTLLAIGDAVREAAVAVDLVYRSTTEPRAAVVVVSDRCAALLSAVDPARGPVRVAPLDPAQAVTALVDEVGAVAAGRGAAVTVPADVFDPGGPPPGVPRTVRAETNARAARELVDGATGWGQAGVARTDAGDRVPPVMWLDGPHGRHRVVHDRHGGGARVLLVGVDGEELADDLRRSADLTARPSGRSSS